MSECYVNVVGGLGNQLFQIAAGYAYAKKHNKRLIINPANWNAGQGNNPLTYRDTIFKNFEYGNYYTRDVVGYYEKRFNYDEIPHMPGSIALNGYFQSFKYFEDVKDEFVSKLILPEVSSDFINQFKIGIHIRRGDYLKFPMHNICNKKYFDYFFNAYKEFDIKVFTDSPDIVTKEFSEFHFELLKSESDLKELAYMSKCDILIGSNSTFSWWASLLGGMECHFPSKWFSHGRPHEDIFRKDMILRDV